jgi:hypothetical protein
MKNVTLSADAALIDKARELAHARHTTLNAAFREWLERYTAENGGSASHRALRERLRHVQAGRNFGRDEMNER